MELVLLGSLFGECRNLFFALSLILRKGHPFANDFSARFVVFHVGGSLAYLIWDGGARSARHLRPRSLCRASHSAAVKRWQRVGGQHADTGQKDMP